MIETGTVLEATATTARIRLEPTASCETCGSKGSCAGSAGKPFVVNAENACAAQPGDRVQVEMTPAPAWMAIVFVFVVPIVLMLAGFAAGYQATGQDWGAAVGAAVGLVAGFVSLWAANRALLAHSEYNPTIIRVMKEG